MEGRIESKRAKSNLEINGIARNVKKVEAKKIFCADNISDIPIFLRIRTLPKILQGPHDLNIEILNSMLL